MSPAGNGLTVASIGPGQRCVDPHGQRVKPAQLEKIALNPTASTQVLPRT
jgi:hypothetical protein